MIRIFLCGMAGYLLGMFMAFSVSAIWVQDAHKRAIKDQEFQRIDAQERALVIEVNEQIARVKKLNESNCGSGLK